jgi:hypothetical protein
MTTKTTDNDEGLHLAAIDGDDSLQAQEDKLNQAQNGFTAEVTTYEKAEGGKPPNSFEHTNNATFTEVPIGGKVRAIHLSVVENDDPPTPGDGQEVAFASEAYVDGEVKRVIGLH